MKKLLLIAICCCTKGYAQNLIDNYLSGTPTYTVIASSADAVNQPKDLDFKPHTNELWIVNKGNSAGGTNVIIYNAGESNQSSEFRMDTHSGHFMIYPTAIAFGDNGNFGTTNEIKNTAAPSSTFMGPALWSGDTSIFARIFQNNWDPTKPLGSHLDMLHQSPFAMGIAHDSANMYWVFDGHNGNLCKYDFAGDHSPGYDDHSNGKVWRYTDVPLTRQVDVPGHMVKDPSTGWLYIVDAGAKKIKRVNTNTGSVSGNLSVPSTSLEPLAGYWSVTGAVVEMIDSFNASQPSGIDVYNNRLIVGDYTTGDIHVYDISGTITKLGTIATGQAGMTGIKIGSDGKIWFVNNTQNTVIRANPSTNVDNDVAVIAITSPLVNNFEAHYYNDGFNQCIGTVTPVVTIQNTGNLTLTAATINYQIDKGSVHTFNWTGSLAPNATASVTLPTANVIGGSHELLAEAMNPNNVPDENPANNSKAGAFRVFEMASNNPFSEDFSNAVFPPAGWAYISHNFNNEYKRDANIGAFGSNSGSAKMDNYSGQVDISGQKDYLITPMIDLSSSNNVSLYFTVAYSQYDASSNDGLSVKASTDCGQTWTEIYNKSGAVLSTASPTTASFVPSSSEWRTEQIPLTNYAGQSNVLFQFMNTSGYGNNLYLDDIAIMSTNSIKELPKTQFAVYPNPAKDFFTIEAFSQNQEPVSVQLMDINGKLVKKLTQSGNKKINVDISELVNGTYILKIISDKYIQQEKIIIVK